MCQGGCPVLRTNFLEVIIGQNAARQAHWNVGGIVSGNLLAGLTDLEGRSSKVPAVFLTQASRIFWGALAPQEDKLPGVFDITEYPFAVAAPLLPHLAVNWCQDWHLSSCCSHLPSLALIAPLVVDRMGFNPRLVWGPFNWPIKFSLEGNNDLINYGNWRGTSRAAVTAVEYVIISLGYKGGRGIIKSNFLAWTVQENASFIHSLMGRTKLPSLLSFFRGLCYGAFLLPFCLILTSEFIPVVKIYFYPAYLTTQFVCNWLFSSAICPLFEEVPYSPF